MDAAHISIGTAVAVAAVVVGAAWKLMAALNSIRVSQARVEEKLETMATRERLANAISEHEARCPGREPTGVR